MSHLGLNKVAVTFEGGNTSTASTSVSNSFRKDSYWSIAPVVQGSRSFEATSYLRRGDVYAEPPPSLGGAHSGLPRQSRFIYRSKERPLKSSPFLAAAILAVAIVIYRCLRLVSSSLVQNGASRRFLAGGTTPPDQRDLECELDDSTAGEGSYETANSDQRGATRNQTVPVGTNEGNGHTGASVDGVSTDGASGASARGRNRGRLPGGEANNETDRGGLTQPSPRPAAVEANSIVANTRLFAENMMKTCSILLLTYVVQVLQIAFPYGQPSSQAGYVDEEVQSSGVVGRIRQAVLDSNMPLVHNVSEVLGRVYSLLFWMRNNPVVPPLRTWESLVTEAIVALRVMQCMLFLDSMNIVPLRMSRQALAHNLVVVYLRLNNADIRVLSALPGPQQAVTYREIIHTVILMGLRGNFLDWRTFVTLSPADYGVVSSLITSYGPLVPDIGAIGGSLLPGANNSDQVVPTSSGSPGYVEGVTEGSLQEVPSSSSSPGPPLLRLGPTYAWDASLLRHATQRWREEEEEDQVVPRSSHDSDSI